MAAASQTSIRHTLVDTASSRAGPRSTRTSPVLIRIRTSGSQSAVTDNRPIAARRTVLSVTTGKAAMPGPTVRVASKVCRKTEAVVDSAASARAAEALPLVVGSAATAWAAGTLPLVVGSVATARAVAALPVVVDSNVAAAAEAIGGSGSEPILKHNHQLKGRRTRIVKFSSQDSRTPIPCRHRFVQLALAVACLPVLLGVPAAFAQQSSEKTFASPGNAVLALYNAAKSNDIQSLNAIFGSHAGPILHAGDDVADKKMRADFIRRYDQMHRVVIEPDQTATLYIGAENWPMPIPIVKNSSGAWYFDTEVGAKEILYRRVGRNENDTIDLLHTLVAAQREYAAMKPDGNSPKHYAMKFISDQGKQNGLYWNTKDDETPSPIGPMVVAAAAEGYTRKQGQPTPFHGYYFHMLTKQGPAAKGGARDYVVNGQLTRGFAFVAYPAEYRNSGVMTFIVNQDNVVYEKDLGQDTKNLAAATSEYNPDKTWRPTN